jgi:predicted RNase H-like nuclease (RuvC/YqgF family)
VKDLQTALSNERGSNSSALQELKETKKKIEYFNSKISDLEAANLNLNQKIADITQLMEDMKSGHRAQMHAKEDEIKRLLDELANQMKEYQNLQDVKIALDMEIAVFRQLIECEEDRLGLGDRSFDNSLSSSSRSKTPDYKTSVERTSESTFQRKVTVSQTQL